MMLVPNSSARQLRQRRDSDRPQGAGGTPPAGPLGYAGHSRKCWPRRTGHRADRARHSAATNSQN